MRFKPTDEQRRTVKALSGFGVPQPDIAVHLGIDPKTLRKYFREELDRGSIEATASSAVRPTIAIDLGRVGEHRVDPWRGTFVVARVASGGIASGVAQSLVLRARADGDRFQAGPGRPPRSLKLQFQAVGVPAWRRSGPVVVGTGSIVYVPGLGLDARAVSEPGTPRVSIDWRAD